MLETNMNTLTALSADERIALQRDCIVEHMRAENAHDWDAVYDTFIRDERSSYDVIPMSAVFNGFQGVQDFYAAFDAAFPDFKLRNSAEYDVPGCSIREVTVTGTHRGEFCGIAATGRPVTFELAAFYVFGEGEEAGRLMVERVYFDLETVLRQLRGEADAPTGVGLIERTH
jgi:predicted ester cyclase